MSLRQPAYVAKLQLAQGRHRCQGGRKAFGVVRRLGTKPIALVPQYKPARSIYILRAGSGNAYTNPLHIMVNGGMSGSEIGPGKAHGCMQGTHLVKPVQRSTNDVGRANADE